MASDQPEDSDTWRVQDLEALDDKLFRTVVQKDNRTLRRALKEEQSRLKALREENHALSRQAKLDWFAFVILVLGAGTWLATDPSKAAPAVVTCILGFLFGHRTAESRTK